MGEKGNGPRQVADWKACDLTLTSKLKEEREGGEGKPG